MTETESQPDPVAALLKQAVELDEVERLGARNRFMQRVQREREPTFALRYLRYAAPLGVALGVLVAVFYWKTPWASEAGLEYTVEGATRDGDYVRAPHNQPANIIFSDKTRLEAAPGTRLRIDGQASPHGARVAVEQGLLDVAVTHSEAADWSFNAGPFNVHVTGTRFMLGWDAEHERLEVVMHSGSVEVEGYAGSGRVSVRAGQRFVGDARLRTMLVSDIVGPSEAGEAKALPPASASAALTPVPPTAAEPEPALVGSAPQHVTSGAQKLAWSKLVAKGSFRQVVDEASARGTSECLSSCSAEDLNALADAARYVGRGDLAEQSLLALRKRQSSAYGVRAAFLLGRLYERRGSMGHSKSWYETALREGPGGAFASEALAGKMRSVNALEGKAAARPVAREYLSRYPKGVHARAAEQLLERP